MFVFTFFRHLTPYSNKFTLNTSCSYRRTLDESCSGLVQKKWVGCLQKAVNDVTRKDIHCRYSVHHVKDLWETWVILLQRWQHLAPTNVARDLLSVDTISVHFRKFSLRVSRLFSSVFPGNRRIKGEPRVLDIRHSSQKLCAFFAHKSPERVEKFPLAFWAFQEFLESLER